ncbi:MAG: tyrosine-type recombinase/integrase [Coriobacteriales bacterium]|nr:tyrosine-type recombinase/integrase [Coriobacteriales bacterium]
MRQKQVTVHGSRAKAEYKAEQLYEELTENIVANSKYTLRQYYENVFLPSKAKTSKANRLAMRVAWAHVPDEWKDAEIREPSETEIQLWVNGMREGTARSAVKYLRATLRRAYGDGLLKHKPMAAKAKYENEEPARHVWDDEETAMALLAVRGLPIEPYILVALGAGLRREEAIALTWSDIECVCGVAWVNVNKTVTEADGRRNKMKTKASERRVPVTGYVAARLAEIRGTGPLMKNKNGEALSIGGLNRRWKNLWREGGHVRVNVHRPDGALLAAGVTRIPPNNLRHTHTSIMSEAGVDPTTSDAYHGHAPRSIEAKHYIKRHDGRLLSAARTCAERIDAWVRYVGAGMVH